MELRPIPGFAPCYAAGEDGEIYKARKGKPMLCMKSRAGKHRKLEIRLVVTRGRRKWANVHVLVATAFYGPAPFVGALVRHLDDNGHNNRASNLRWGTYEENAMDAVANGRHRGKAFTDEEVADMRKMHAEGIDRRIIVAMFMAAPITVIACLKRQTYKHLP